MNYLQGEILLIDKPLRWTSFDACKRLRSAMQRRMGIKKLKVGHAGTLDPLATGVMIICTGRATKRIDQLQAGVKEYVATLELGATTPSFDLEKEIDAIYPTDHINRDTIESVIPKFVGAIEQVPPAFSACKVDGKRAYQMARRGKDPGLKPKLLVIDEIEIVDYQPGDANQRPRLTLRIVCSKGTYIRALARDIGEALNSGAHLVALRRTRVGDIDISQCLTVDQAIQKIETEPFEMPDEYDSTNSSK